MAENLDILAYLPLEPLAELRRVHLARHGHDSSADVAPTDVSTPVKPKNQENWMFLQTK